MSISEKSHADIAQPLNKEIIQALAIHAKQIAKAALSQEGAGVNLVDDVKVKLIN